MSLTERRAEAAGQIRGSDVTVERISQADFASMLGSNDESGLINSDKNETDDDSGGNSDKSNPDYDSGGSGSDKDMSKADSNASGAKEESSDQDSCCAKDDSDKVAHASDAAAYKEQKTAEPVSLTRNDKLYLKRYRETGDGKWVKVRMYHGKLVDVPNSELPSRAEVLAYERALTDERRETRKDLVKQVAKDVADVKHKKCKESPQKQAGLRRLEALIIHWANLRIQEKFGSDLTTARRWHEVRKLIRIRWNQQPKTTHEALMQGDAHGLSSEDLLPYEDLLDDHGVTVDALLSREEPVNETHPILGTWICRSGLDWGRFTITMKNGELHFTRVCEWSHPFHVPKTDPPAVVTGVLHPGSKLLDPVKSIGGYAASSPQLNRLWYDPSRELRKQNFGRVTWAFLNPCRGSR
jgi:hypothetical protein